MKEHIQISRVPIPLFLGIALDYNIPPVYGVYTTDGSYGWDYHVHHYDTEECATGVCDYHALHNSIIEYIKNYQQEKHCKVIIAGLANCGDKRLHHLAKLLWKELDILPCITSTRGDSLGEKASSVSRKGSQMSNFSLIPGLIRNSVGYRHEVLVDHNGEFLIADLADYAQFYGNGLFKDILKEAARVKRQNKSIVFINSTHTSGGVAIMRHSLIRFFKLLGVKASWHILKPNPSVFDVTKKKFHNVLQGVCPPDTTLTEEEIDIWKKWCENNVETYWSDSSSPMRSADVIVIDDPQPSATIPLLKKINRKARFIYRSHIQIRADLVNTEGTIQNKVWGLLWENIKLCDTFVSHPVNHFIPSCVPTQKLVQMPATLDPLDALNKKLDQYSLVYYRVIFNRIALDNIGRKVNFDRPYFTQISRFDPSKGLPTLIDSYIQFRNLLTDTLEKEVPQLIICGHGAIDDPEGGPVYESLVDYINSFKGKVADHILDDIYALRLPPSDHLLNMVLSGSLALLFMSSREGFEIKISESLHKGIPVIATRAGGIPLQITDGVDGFLVAVGDHKAVAQRMKDLICDAELYQRMCKNAEDISREQFMTPANAYRWMKLIP